MRKAKFCARECTFGEEEEENNRKLRHVNGIRVTLSRASSRELAIQIPLQPHAAHGRFGSLDGKETLNHETPSRWTRLTDCYPVVLVVLHQPVSPVRTDFVYSTLPSTRQKDKLLY